MLKVLLKNTQSPGDILMITSAVRDLYRSCRSQIQIGVKTTAMPIWYNNPYVDFDIDQSNADKIITVHYDLIHKSNITPIHFMTAVRKDLQKQLNVKIEPGDFKVDIHLTKQEKQDKTLINSLIGQDRPFWIIDAGYKFDFTAKMWQFAKFQQVVDQLKNQILFIQIGQKNEKHFHKPLKNVINAIGKTQNVRDFIKLMYNSSGVLTPVSFPMHLSTMCGRSDRILKTRPCVVIAGGRQPSTWQAYTNHNYIHRCGTLPCCDLGGCWKARIQQLHDGASFDKSICALPCLTESGQMVPLCMNSISVQQVVKAIRRANANFKLMQSLRELGSTYDIQMAKNVAEKYKKIYS